MVEEFEKGEIIADLKLALAKIEDPPRRVYDFDDYLFSNDLGMEALVPQIKEKVQRSDAQLKVGLVVGSGGLLSFGKEMAGIDLWIVLDINSKQIKSIKSWHDQVINYNGRTNELGKAAGQLPNPELLDKESASFGRYHYTYDQTSLSETQKFLRANKVVFVCGDIAKKEFMDNLGTVLKDRQAQIVFINLTNVAQWVDADLIPEKNKAFGESLGKLPFSSEAVFLHTISFRTELAESLESYLEKVKDVNSRFFFKKKN